MKRIALFISMLSIMGCTGTVEYIEITPGCPKVPATVFKRVGVDAKLGASSFGKVVTGDASLKIDPSIVSVVSEVVTDDQITEAYICSAGKRGELKSPEQFEHARKVARFYRTKPTSEVAAKFHKENPFPKSPGITELFKISDQLASKRIETRLVAVHSLVNLGQAFSLDSPRVIEILSAFIKNNSDNKHSHEYLKIPADLQAAMSAIVSEEFAMTSPQPLSLSGTNLPEVSLPKGQMEKANLSDIHWQRGDLSYANLQYAYLTGAHLDEADLSHANLTGANLLGASLEMADLRNATLRDANLQGVSLKGAILELADLSNADLREARTDGVIWTNAKVCGALGVPDKGLYSKTNCVPGRSQS